MLLLSLLLLEPYSVFCLPDSVYSTAAHGIQSEGKPLPFPQGSADIWAHAALTFPCCVCRSRKYRHFFKISLACPVLDYEVAVTMEEIQLAFQTADLLELRCPQGPSLPCTWAIAQSFHGSSWKHLMIAHPSTGEGTLPLQPPVLMVLICLHSQSPIPTAPSRGRAKLMPQFHHCLTLLVTHVSTSGLWLLNVAWSILGGLQSFLGPFYLVVPQDWLTVCPTDFFSKRYSATTDAAAPSSDLSREPIGVFQRKGELNSPLQTHMNDVLAARKRKGMERTLEKWHFSLCFSLLAIYIDFHELTVLVVHADINTEKLANLPSTSWVGAHGSKSLLIRSIHFKREGDSTTSVRKGSLETKLEWGERSQQSVLLSLT